MALASALLLGLVALTGTHVRSTTPEIRELIHEGEELSMTLRDQIARLSASDLVVYVEYDYFPATHVAGFVSFIGAGGGWRYLKVSIRWDLPRGQQLAILGHELQHAAEIAAAAEVVDPLSMARLYARIGSERRSARCRAFDTRAAVDVEGRVRSEVNSLRRIHGPVVAASRGSGIH